MLAVRPGLPHTARMPSPTPARRPAAPSALARWLEPIAGSLWILFVVWTVIVAAVWLSGFGEAPRGEGPVTHADFKAALAWALRALDPLWILLAAANIYLSLAASEGLRAARRWAGMILLVALGVCVLSLVTRWPLGPISFPRRLGMQIFGVPFGVPLLWFILVAGGREVVARVLPRASHLQMALLTGLLAAASACLMEPIAREDRAWWLWREGLSVVGVPLRNFLTWGIVSAGLAYAFRPRLVPLPGAERWKVIATWAALHLVFLLRLGVRSLS